METTSRKREREGCMELLCPKVHELLENFQDILNLIGQGYTCNLSGNFLKKLKGRVNIKLIEGKIG